MRLHEAAVFFSAKTSPTVSGLIQSQFDYLLNATPGIDPAQQYDMFALELLPQTHVQPKFPKADVRRSVREAFRDFLRDVPAQLFEVSTIEASLAFAALADRQLANCAHVCLVNASSLQPFLTTEVSRDALLRRARSASAVEARLACRELDLALQRTECLSKTIFCAASKHLIRQLIRSHLFLEFAHTVSNSPSFVQNVASFTKFRDRLIARFWEIIGARHQQIHVLSRSGYSFFLNDIFHCFIVNRIQMQRFIDARADLQMWIQNVLATDSLVPLHRFAKQAPSTLVHDGVLTSQVDVVSRAFASESFADMLHGVLSVVDVINTLIPKEIANPEDILRMAICWIVIHEDMGRFINWVYFMAYFFPSGEKLVDIIGGLDAMNWRYFEEVFKLIPANRTNQ
jgi:hypothetical protein